MKEVHPALMRSNSGAFSNRLECMRLTRAYLEERALSRLRSYTSPMFFISSALLYCLRGMHFGKLMS